MSDRSSQRFTWKYRILLGSTLLLATGSSLLSEYPGLRKLFSLFFALGMIGGIYALSGNRRFLRFAWTLVGVTLILHVLTSINSHPFLEVVGALSAILFFVLVVKTILEHILQTHQVNEESIVGAICVFLILGTCWALIYTSIELLAPNSFDFGGYGGQMAGASDRNVLYPALNYYSFVTLTTLGFGDITPLSAPARVFSYLEAVTGQIYLAVIIAGLVGIRISNRIMRGNGS